MVDNETTALSLSKSSELLGNPYVIIPATTYDIEMINGLSSLLDQGKIHDGDAVGVIWFEGEYGANSLRGVRYFAKLHHLTLREVEVSATDANLRDAVTTFAGAPRVRAIALSTTPQQSASVALVNQQLRLTVPLIGNSPAFTPALPDAGVTYGYATGEIWGQLLKRACAATASGSCSGSWRAAVRAACTR